MTAPNICAARTAVARLPASTAHAQMSGAIRPLRATEWLLKQCSPWGRRFKPVAGKRP